MSLCLKLFISAFASVSSLTCCCANVLPLNLYEHDTIHIRLDLQYWFHDSIFPQHFLGGGEKKEENDVKDLFSKHA